VQLIPSGSSLTFIVRNGQQRASPATIASRRSRTVEPGANRSSARMPTRRDSSRAASPSAAISARRAENSVALSEHAIGWSVAWIPPRLWVAVPLRFRVNLGLSQEPDSHDADDVHNRPARAAFGTECVRDPLLRARRRLARAGARERAAPPRRRGGQTRREASDRQASRLHSSGGAAAAAGSEAGDPLHEPLRELAARKLPEIEALLARTTSLRAWLLAATGCSCETLDACALFSDAASEGNTTPLRCALSLSVLRALDEMLDAVTMTTGDAAATATPVSASSL
jgi:hypothetical protein